MSRKLGEGIGELFRVRSEAVAVLQHSSNDADLNDGLGRRLGLA